MSLLAVGKGAGIRLNEPAGGQQLALSGWLATAISGALLPQGSSPPSPTQYVHVSGSAGAVRRPDFYRTFTGPLPNASTSLSSALSSVFATSVLEIGFHDVLSFA